MSTMVHIPVRVKPLEIEVDRKSTRLNSSHLVISYAVFCLKKKKIASTDQPTRRLSIQTTVRAAPFLIAPESRLHSCIRFPTEYRGARITSTQPRQESTACR